MSQVAMVWFGGWVAGAGRDGANFGDHPGLNGLLLLLQLGVTGMMDDLWPISRAPTPPSRQRFGQSG